MTSEELRGSVEKIVGKLMYDAQHGVFGINSYKTTDEILSLIKQGIEEAEPKDKYTESVAYECPKCFSYGEKDTYCTNDRRKLLPKISKYTDDGQEGYNQGKANYKSNLLQMVEGKK